MMTASDSPTMELAQFAARLRFEDLPADVVAAAKRCLYDAVGVTLLGASTAWAREIRAYLHDLGGAPQATLAGFGDRVSCLDAAYGNGIFAKTPELEDGHRLLAMFHLAPTVIPAMLALAEWKAKSGRELLTAIVVGYEIAVRLGDAMDVARRSPVRVIPTVSAGVMGVAAGAARLLGDTPERIIAAWNVAALQMPASVAAGISSLRTVTTGGTARSGLEAALMAGRLSLLGSGLAFEGSDGYCARMSGVCRTPQLTRDLGRLYHVTAVYYKPFPSCRYTHAPVTALLALLERRVLPVSEVSEVLVRVGPEGHIVNRAELLPASAPFHEVQTSAKFSIPYVVASTLLRGRPTIEHFEPAALADPAVRALMTKVRVVDDPECHAMPERMPALVDVRLASGEHVSSRTDYPHGEPEDPMSDAELRGKFQAGVTAALGRERIDELERLLVRVDELEDITPLAAGLRP